MNWLLILVVLIFLISIGVGIYRGALKILVSLVTTVVVLIAAVVLTPYAAKGLAKLTPIDDMVEEHVSSAITSYASGALDGEESSGITEDAVRKVLNAAGVTDEMLEEYGFTVEDIVNGNVSKEDLEAMGISSQILDGINEAGSSLADDVEEADIPEDVQAHVIENSGLPEAFKELLTENNNDKSYTELGVETFGQYVASYLSNLIMHAIAFVILFLVITIVSRAIIFALDIVTNLPVIGALNRTGGAILGIVGALFIVWFIFLLITLMYAAGIGEGIYKMIQNDSILSMIYQYNPIMAAALRF